MHDEIYNPVSRLDARIPFTMSVNVFSPNIISYFA
jgi:hypothetical protein